MFTFKNLFIASTSIAINAKPSTSGLDEGFAVLGNVMQQFGNQMGQDLLPLPLTSEVKKSLEEDIRSFDEASKALKGHHDNASAKADFGTAFDKVLDLTTFHHLDLTLTAINEGGESSIKTFNEAKETYDKALKDYKEAVKNNVVDVVELKGHVAEACLALRMFLVGALEVPIIRGNVEMKVEIKGASGYGDNSDTDAAKPFYKKAWFVIIMILLAVLAIGAGLYFGLRK